MLCVAADVSARVVEVDDGFSDGVFAAVSGSWVHVTHSAGTDAHHRPRMFMLVPHLPSRQRRWWAAHFEQLACPRVHVLVLNLRVPSQ